jgi:hypothetical protein
LSYGDDASKGYELRRPYLVADVMFPENAIHPTDIRNCDRIVAAQRLAFR